MRLSYSIPIVMCLALLGLPVAAGAEEGGAADHGGQADAAEGHGAAAGGHGMPALNWIDFSNPHAAPLVAMIANFVLLVIIVYKLLKRPIGDMVKHRHIGLKEALEQARAQKEAAEAALATARAQLEELEAEVDRVRRQIIEAGEAEANSIRREAAQRTERLHADTKAVIEQEVARMSQVIREQVVDRIVAQAEQLVREKIQRSDQDRLSREYVDEIGKRAGGQAG